MATGVGVAKLFEKGKLKRAGRVAQKHERNGHEPIRGWKSSLTTAAAKYELQQRNPVPTLSHTMAHHV